MFLLCRCGGLRGGIAALHDFHPHSRVRHWDGLWSSLVKGEGEFGGCVGLFTRVTLPPLWIADQVRNDGPEEVGVGLLGGCWIKCEMMVRGWC